MRLSQRLCSALVLYVPLLAWSEQTAAARPAQTKVATDAEAPSNVQRSPADTAVGLEGLIRLDVLVTNEAGHPITGLERTDFKLFDNGKPQKIVAFRASHNATVHFEPPVIIILFIDTLDLAPDLAAFERQQAAQFLRQVAGSLAQPVTIYSLENSGFWLVAKPSSDGNAQARYLESDQKVDLLFAPPGTHFKDAAIDKIYSQFPPYTALRAIATIAAEEYQRPGKKRLLWIGPSLNSGTGGYLDRTYYFHDGGVGGGSTFIDLFNPKLSPDIFGKICWLSTLLRLARVSIDTFSVGKEEWSQHQKNWLLEKDAWRPFLTRVPSPRQASIMSLYKKVLAIQSGGRVLPDEKDLALQIAARVEQDSMFYTLTVRMLIV
jgi:hypothetical protein